MSEFWIAVRDLAAMRRFIPEERRAMSGVREWVRQDVLRRPVKP